MRDTLITKKSLIENGWYKWQDIDPYFLKSIKNKNKRFYCTIRQFSNTVGRDWTVHIDSDRFETVGTMDIATFEQLNKFIKLLSE